MLIVLFKYDFLGLLPLQNFNGKSQESLSIRRILTKSARIVVIEVGLLGYILIQLFYLAAKKISDFCRYPKKFATAENVTGVLLKQECVEPFDILLIFDKLIIFNRLVISRYRELARE